jgi:hypothetical protein
VINQRSLEKSGRLAPSRKSRLDQLGFDWGLLESRWEANFAALERYKERFGDCNVPQGWEENPLLASWVTIQRERKASGKLSSERERRLNAIGFVWDPLDSSWEAMFTELKRYKDEHGDCNVPGDWGENIKLANWVGNQRQLQKKGKLSPERKARLDAIGFDWDPYGSTWEAMFTEVKRYKDEHGDNVAFHYLRARADCDGLLGRGSSQLKLCRVPHHVRLQTVDISLFGLQPTSFSSVVPPV